MFGNNFSNTFSNGDALTGAGNPFSGNGSWDFSEGNWDFGDRGASGEDNTNGNDMLGQFQQSPFGRLLDLPGIDGPEDIFGNLGSAGGGNPFAGGVSGGFGSAGGGNPFAGGMSGDLPFGGNPFAGDNFWDIFAGGVNPSDFAMVGVS